MRFYVPDWDDNVDAEYDFVHDEHSALAKDDRDLQYIWDIFDYETTPIDGLLISREQIEGSRTSRESAEGPGIYDPDSDYALPDWLPTISDCGAWGYKSLPFPPYGNADMLEFYEELGVTTGVTIDHLVLGSGHESRLYLDERALGDGVTGDDLPDELQESADIMIEEWPPEWPSYVTEYAPEITEVGSVEPFSTSMFDGAPEEILARLRDDPRAVYRANDSQFRYDLTLENAREMYDLYQEREYPFRLMVAIQGWSPDTYSAAASEVLELGYDYLGIGGIAGSPTDAVRNVVSEVGSVITEHEREQTTRVDTHVFGFAKTPAFDTIGRSGVTSFDSASMLRSAWTSGNNYHLDADRKFDALRVRYPSHMDDLQTSIEKAFRAQEVLHALRAFDEQTSIADALHTWHDEARQALDALEPYLREHRWDDDYDQRLLREVEGALRDNFEHASIIKASYSDDFRREVVRRLRKDDPEDPVDFGEYEELIEQAETVLEQRVPGPAAWIEEQETEASEVATFEQVWPLIEDYATWDVIDDGNLLEEYERLLRTEPWRECDCVICSEYGIEVAIFRGNNRNRRRGFHNTRRFYDQFEDELPRLLVATPADASIPQYQTVETFLRSEREALWSVAHDLPVAEIGVADANGIHEWASPVPEPVSLAPDAMEVSLAHECVRYQDLYLFDPDGYCDAIDSAAIEANDCDVHIFTDPGSLRSAVLDRLGYDDDYLPNRMVQSGLGDY